MSVRWRLGALAVQLAILLVATHLATQAPWNNSIWFFSGLLAVALNRQLLEPFFARPADTLANSIVGLLLVAVADKTVATPGWWAAGVLLALSATLSLIAQILGLAGERRDRWARAARRVTSRATAMPIYSVLFFLDLLESFDPRTDAFWQLAIAWGLVTLIGSVDWQSAWRASQGGAAPAEVVGFVGPSRILLTRQHLPAAGSAVRLRKGETEAEGVLVRRIRRPDDVYGEVFLPGELDPEQFLTGSVEIEPVLSVTETVGVVDHGSTDRVLRFTATRELAVGDAVFVPQGGGELIYQITGAEIRRKDERTGAALETTCTALQLGHWNSDRGRIERHAWVAPPGAAVTERSRIDSYEMPTPDDCVQLGHVLGSGIPVFLDLPEASTGHLLVLGMTKMGKSTLAIRLAEALAQTRPVVILDQTGEYRTRYGVPTCTAQSLVETGLSLKEPSRGEIGPIVAHSFFEKLLEQMATDEYETSQVQGRTVLVEEAHQFIPEPAGLGFGTPGRDEAYKLGTMMMQIRKYGLSVVLISQRTAVVGKSAISQCENIIAFRSVDKTGLDYLEGIMGRESVELLPRLRQGQAIVAGPAFNADEPVAVQISM